MFLTLMYLKQFHNFSSNAMTLYQRLGMSNTLSSTLPPPSQPSVGNSLAKLSSVFLYWFHKNLLIPFHYDPSKVYKKRTNILLKFVVLSIFPSFHSHGTNNAKQKMVPLYSIGTAWCCLIVCCEINICSCSVVQCAAYFQTV